LIVRALSLGLGAALLVGRAACDDASVARELQELRKKAIAAYQSKDWPAFLNATRQAFQLQPSRPGNAYNLACAEALSGDFEAAARLLGGLLDQGIDYGLTDSPDFAEARKNPSFQPLLSRVAELSKPLGGSTVAFRLLEKDLLTEGIAHDAKTGAFFVGSVHRRKIVRFSAEGQASDFVRSGQDGIEGVFALAVDSPRRLLWASTAAVPQMQGYEPRLEGSTALVAIDLASGRIVSRVALEADGKPHVLNDLTVDSHGDVYSTDSVGGGVFVARRGGTRLETFIPPGVFRSPQGLAFSADGRSLYIADWTVGLFVVDRASRIARPLAPPQDAHLLGIDGLARSGRDLVVTQNFLKPHQVALLTLDDSGSRVLRTIVLDRADAEFEEPTLGVVVGDSFYVVAKSQWGRFDEKTGAPAADLLVEPTILKIGLPPRG